MDLLLPVKTGSYYLLLSSMIVTRIGMTAMSGVKRFAVQAALKIVTISTGVNLVAL
jgi:hypothetical protein